MRENSSGSRPDIDKNWIPYRFAVNGGEIHFRWLFTGDKKITEPFFDETIAACLSLKENAQPGNVLTSAAELLRLSENTETLPPAAFIFHISRCGSTLLSQLLAVDERNVVLPEMPLLDDLLSEKPGMEDPSLRESLYAACLRLAGSKRNEHAQHLFVKTDSWHLFHYDVLRRLYPQVPFVILFRSPGEVLESHFRKKGMHMVPGLIAPSQFGMQREEVAAMNERTYMLRLLECYLRECIRIAQQDDRVLLIDHAEGGMEMVQRVMRAVGIQAGEKLLAAMRNRSLFHSKEPQRIYADENRGKNFSAEELQEAMSLYRELSVLREERL